MKGSAFVCPSVRNRRRGPHRVRESLLEVGWPIGGSRVNAHVRVSLVPGFLGVLVVHDAGRTGWDRPASVSRVTRDDVRIGEQHARVRTARRIQNGRPAIGIVESTSSTATSDGTRGQTHSNGGQPGNNREQTHETPPCCPSAPISTAKQAQSASAYKQGRNQTMRRNPEERNRIKRQSYKPHPRQPLPDPGPEWLTARQVAAALGVPVRNLTSHLHNSYSWLPMPELDKDSPRFRMLWPLADTFAAIEKGRSTFSAGWHAVPEVPQAEVWVDRVKRARPTKVRLTGMPNTSAARSVIGDAVELALQRHFGCRRFIDGILTDGVHPLRDHAADIQGGWHWH